MVIEKRPVTSLGLVSGHTKRTVLCTAPQPLWIILDLYRQNSFEFHPKPVPIHPSSSPGHSLLTGQEQCRCLVEGCAASDTAAGSTGAGRFFAYKATSDVVHWPSQRYLTKYSISCSCSPRCSLGLCNRRVTDSLLAATLWVSAGSLSKQAMTCCIHPTWLPHCLGWLRPSGRAMCFENGEQGVALGTPVLLSALPNPLHKAQDKKRVD